MKEIEKSQKQAFCATIQNFKWKYHFLPWFNLQKAQSNSNLLCKIYKNGVIFGIWQKQKLIKMKKIVDKPYYIW